MTWDVARTALELLLCSPRAPRLLVLSGGEPLLAGDLFRRCVELARARFPSPADLRIAASTNGTLFGDHLVRFLAANDVALQVSYDGAGQEQRAPGTAPAVAAALRRLGELEVVLVHRRVSQQPGRCSQRRRLPHLLATVTRQAHQRIGTRQQAHLVLFEARASGQVLCPFEQRLPSGFENAIR